MINDDAQLIHKTLSGSEVAFNALVRKYQKSVHAHIWRKIGDFHFAEEITQDTFLRAYKKLATLRNPNRFSKWIHTIANRLCLSWIRKKKPAIQSLEITRVDVIEESFYARYVSGKREIDASECRHEIVQKLLQRLPEHERKVVTLHYLDEMSVKEIGKFLGLPVNTIKSRLWRARERLQRKEKDSIFEVLASVQVSVNPRKGTMS